MLFRSIRSLLLIVVTVCAFACKTTSQADNPELKVISTLAAYQEQVKANANNELIELKSLAPNLVYDIRYATENNFMKRFMYPEGTNEAYLRAPFAQALQRVQAALNEKGLGLKIFDAYRPYAVTVKFWDLVQDERYVANPKNGSGHNRGIAIDLTIIDLKTGEELDMGTGYDDFTETAHSTYTDLPEPILKNRQLLTAVMEAEGFKVLRTEWWHFSVPNSNHFDVMDIPFSELKKQGK